MNLFSRVILVLCLIILVVSCKTLPKGVTPIGATYFYGLFTLPASVTISGKTESFSPFYENKNWSTSADKLIKPGVKVPVAIHMHGCGGISANDESMFYRDLMLSQGYAVILPDSFQRPGREKLCGKGKMFTRISMRKQEVKFALKRIRELPWVDQDRLVLMGFSEGGNTTDNWHTDDFCGLIVLGSACTHSGGSPMAPKHVPVLAIVGEHDDYRPGESCTITRKAAGSKSIVIPGADHWIATYRQTKEAIKEFLKVCCS